MTIKDLEIRDLYEIHRAHEIISAFNEYQIDNQGIVDPTTQEVLRCLCWILKHPSGSEQFSEALIKIEELLFREGIISSDIEELFQEKEEESK